MESTKVCARCREKKSLDDFHRRAASHDGRQWICKSCMVGVNRDWFKANSHRRKAKHHDTQA